MKINVPVKDKPIIPATRTTEMKKLRTTFLDIVIRKTLSNYTLLFGLNEGLYPAGLNIDPF
jgi:hypothetical protein